MRQRYKMTTEQLNKILDACKPVPYMVIGGVAQRSPQENANDAWRALGDEMGFDWQSVEPDPEDADQRCFTAVAMVD